jgi:CRP-like cAMP-binding protein
MIRRIAARTTSQLVVPFALDRALISDLPLFASLTPEALDHILSFARAQHYPKNKVVFEQGAQAPSFFLLLHGRLRVTQITPTGEQIIVRFVHPGDIFGVAMAIGRKTYPGTSTAVVDSIALTWPSDIWPKLASEHPALAMNAMQIIGSRLQEAHARLREISTEEVERRIAHAMLRLAENASHATKDGAEIDFPLSRQDIAEMTGTTLHTVSRIMSAWEAAGLVESGRQKVAVRDLARLSAIAEGETQD